MHISLPIISMIAFLAVATMSLVWYSHVLFKDNCTRQLRHRAVELNRRKTLRRDAEPEIIWRTLVAAPLIDGRPSLSEH